MEFLDKNGIDAKRTLSQNFLIDGNIIDKIVAFSDIGSEDIVLEIGPGPGALTEKLLVSAKRVIAIEKDHLFAQELLRLEKEESKLLVIDGDALEVDFTALPTPSKIKVVANLPYHITTPLIKKLGKYRRHFSSATVMVQEEVARKITAAHSTKEYGLLSLLSSFYATVSYGFAVAPSCFYPRPKVASAVIRFDFVERETISEEGFIQVIETAFEHRRKMMRASLFSFFEKEVIEQSLERAGLKKTARPEELSLSEWLTFFTYVYPSRLQ